MPVANVPAGFAFANLGRDLLVGRPNAPLSYSDGLPAKRAAMSYCAALGTQLNPAAFGHFTHGGFEGGWQFAGGCV
jgi:hypothetical protein